MTGTRPGDGLTIKQLIEALRERIASSLFVKGLFDHVEWID